MRKHPYPWSDVATTRDLEAMEARLTGRIDRLAGEMDRRFGEMDRRFGESFARQADWARTVLYANLGAVIATASLAFAAARL